MLQSDRGDCSEAYIVVIGNISLTGANNIDATETIQQKLLHKPA